MTDLPQHGQPDTPPEPPVPGVGASRFIPLVLMIVALVLVLLSGYLTRRASEHSILVATQTGQAMVDAMNTRTAATLTMLPTFIRTATPTP